ncbi:DUF1353 domain-containing protein [Brevundimonas sp.]|uniref:DUF1353 domain-containing protein n=1 Tax=Brevundimonas sp. TaxID=1871086 RepID=UPI003D09E59A
MPGTTAKDTEPTWSDRFGGKLVLVLLDNKFSPSIKAARSLWGLQRDLVYTTGACGDRITVPAGFVSDLASIPRWCWIILPPDGPWAKAAIVHDFLYATSGSGHWKKRHDGRTRLTPYGRREADDVFREALANRGVDPLRRTILWAAVRLGGANGWGADDSRQREVTDQDEAFLTEP